MYSFIDTTETPGAGSLPSEALKLNGSYIEDQISGYRTLYVSGREAMAPELTTSDTQNRDGVRLTGRRYPARTITVGYQIIAESAEAFREAYNKLGGLLDGQDSELIFADEPDKYFTGTFSGMGEVEPGRNAVTGEFEFTCTDPFKYSVEEYEVGTQEDEDGNLAFAVDYGGTYKAYPVFEVDFHEDETGDSSSDGRCGYVAFFDDGEHILQFGNPEELSEELIEVVDTSTNTYNVPTTEIPLNHTFKNSASWSGVKGKYTANNGKTYGTDAPKELTGSVAEKHSKNSTAEGTYYLAASDYGSGTSWHGPSITYALTTAATNFNFTWSQKMCVGSAKADKKQRGIFQMILSDSSGTIVAGADVRKNADGTKGSYRMIVNGTAQQSKEIDLSYHNKYFGANRSANAKKKVTAITTVKSGSISKSGSKVAFNLGGIKKTFNISAVKSKSVSKITVFFGTKGAKTGLEYNGIYKLKLVRNYQKSVTETIETIREEWHDVQNKFNVNDVLTADCSDASVSLNDLARPDLGALGNDWEDFYLSPGANQIGVSWSDWVPEGYEPTFKMRYREVFL